MQPYSNATRRNIEDDLNNFCSMEDDIKKIMQPKTIKSKNNDCGTAPGNLVLSI